jgi:ribosomal protein S18 acetylase RimI-like enzyme
MIVRPPREEELPILLKMEMDTFTADLMTPDELEEAYTNNNIMVVAVDEEVVGFSIFYFDYEVEGNLYLYNLLIDKYNRRKGYSKLLLDHFLSIRSLLHTLHVSVSNKAAIILYESMGFRIIDEVDCFYENGESAYLMLKADENKDQALLRKSG